METLRPFLYVVAERCPQTQIIQRRWPQLPRKKLHVGIEVPGQHLKIIEACHQPLLISSLSLERLQLQSERSQLLAQLIVQVPRDAAPLVLLSPDQFCQDVHA